MATPGPSRLAGLPMEREVTAGKIFVKPTKEWQIPARPKPGRKPMTTDPPNRKAQNRAAQRAFRERKQEYVAELEARVQAYEQGEVERNVALQQVAKKLKEENEKLKADNTRLKSEVQQLRSAAPKVKVEPGTSASTAGGKVLRARKGSAVASPASAAEGPPSKKAKVAPAAGRGAKPSPAVSSCSPASLLSPPATSSATSPGSSSSATVVTPPSTMSIPTFTRDNPPPPILTSAPTQSFPLPATTSSSSAAATTTTTTACSSTHQQLLQSPPISHEFDQDEFFSCGFCSFETPCICREMRKSNDMDVDILVSDTTTAAPPPASKTSTTTSSTTTTTTTTTTASSSSTSILNNLPPFQAAMPIKLRKKPANAKPVIALVKPQPECSGDPDNCPACKDDDFGKAFCNALNESVCSTNPCADCPSRSSSGGGCGGGGGGDGDALEGLKCCGDTRLCGQKTCVEQEDVSSALSSLSSGRAGGGFDLPSISSAVGSTIPASEAWRQLKSHPNIGFADLALLADVVARRTRCSGSELHSQVEAVLSSVPASAELTVKLEPTSPPPSSIGPPGDPSRAGLMVPQETLASCGRRRRLRVEIDAVRDALAVLDSTSGGAGTAGGPRE